MQSPLIQGSIDIKNLSFQGKEIIKALLEQGINVDVDGDFLRIGSKLIKGNLESKTDFNNKNPPESPSMNACPFYTNFEHFSEKIDHLYKILNQDRSYSQNSPYIKGEPLSGKPLSGSFQPSTKTYFDKNKSIYRSKDTMRSGPWDIPPKDLQKTQDFLFGNKSFQQDSSKLFSSPYTERIEQLGGKTCRHCGSPLSRNGFFCNHCGNKAEALS
ncbi:MAG: hypothetical protein ACXAEU_02200 [Candidatus Hodarchaeales archaeon]|jgi:hypothetical protein